jgi:hypothetical protein
MLTHIFPMRPAGPSSVADKALTQKPLLRNRLTSILTSTMRLLHSTTLELTEFFDTEVPSYVILSHTWEKEEVTYQDQSSCISSRDRV